MEKKNKVFIAMSIDGYISDKDGSIDWLSVTPNPDNVDLAYSEFMSHVDALVMGRNTFETVCGFDMDWPYDKPVFVLSQRLTHLPEAYAGKAELVKGPLKMVLQAIHDKGYHSLYIDGGRTIQSFLIEDLIDEMTITIIPCLLGEGTPLFSKTNTKLDFECTGSTLFLGKVVQNRFVRKR